MELLDGSLPLSEQNVARRVAQVGLGGMCPVSIMRVSPGRTHRLKALKDVARRARRFEKRIVGVQGGLGRLGRSGPQAVYANILDGRSLWLAVDQKGSLGVRSRSSREVTPLVDDSDAGDEVGAAVRCELSSIGWDTADVYGVVLTCPDGKTRTVRTPPFPSGPVRSPIPSGAQWSYVLQRGRRGALRVARRPSVPVVELVGLGFTEDAIVVTLGRDAPAAARLTDDGGTEVPVSGKLEDDQVTYRIRPDQLPVDAVYSLMVDTPDGPRPVRRRGHALTRPSYALELPVVMAHSSSGSARLAARFDAAGALRFQVREVAG